MKKLLFALLLCSLSLCFVYAQEDRSIAYGETVTGEITNRNYEVAYTFEGKQNDVVIAEMEPTEDFSNLTSPALLLLDAENDVVADTSDLFTLGTTKLAVELPANGTYTLIATRSDGRAGDDVGEFAVRLLLLVELIEGSQTEATIGSDMPPNYYAVRQNGEPFILTYQKMDGEFTPEIKVNRIENSGLTELITLSGDGLEQGQVRLPRGSGLYIVSVEEALFNFSFGEDDAEYTLNIS